VSVVFVYVVKTSDIVAISAPVIEVRDMFEKRVSSENSGSLRELKFLSAARAIFAGKWMILELTVSFLVIAIIVARLQTPLYTAVATIAPQENNQNSLQSGSSALQALGSLSGLDISRNSTIDEFAQLLNAPSTAELMDRRNHVLRRVFSQQWNETERKWVEPSGIIFWARKALYILVGLPVSDHPDEFSLADYISKKVVVTKVRSSNLVTLEYAGKDAAFSAQFLTVLCGAADSIMRDAVKRRAAVNVDFLQEKLQSVQSTELRTALITLLEQQEKALMLASSGDTYAFRFVQPPLAATRPSWPAPIRILAVAILLALFIGVAISVFLFWMAASVPLPRFLETLRIRGSFIGFMLAARARSFPVADNLG
jgi:hypothetical protein